ncbi:hypothetical protein X975_22783, partial [Stegodyphus mimosarum]
MVECLFTNIGSTWQNDYMYKNQVGSICIYGLSSTFEGIPMTIHDHRNFRRGKAHIERGVGGVHLLLHDETGAWPRFQLLIKLQHLPYLRHVFLHLQTFLPSYRVLPRQQLEKNTAISKGRWRSISEKMPWLE